MGNSYIKIARLSFSGKQTAPTLKRKRINIAKFAEKIALNTYLVTRKKPLGNQDHTKYQTLYSIQNKKKQ